MWRIGVGVGGNRDSLISGLWSFGSTRALGPGHRREVLAGGASKKTQSAEGRSEGRRPTYAAEHRKAPPGSIGPFRDPCLDHLRVPVRLVGPKCMIVPQLSNPGAQERMEYSCGPRM